MKWPFRVSSRELSEGSLENAPSTLFLVGFFFATQRAVCVVLDLKYLKVYTFHLSEFSS